MVEKRKGLILDAFARPLAKVETSLGTVFVYQADAPTRREFSALAGEAGAVRGAKFLRRIASLKERTTFKEAIESLSDDTLAALADDEVSAIAEQFRACIDRQRVVSESPRPAIAPRKPEEDPLAFFDRVLQQDIAEDQSEMQRVFEQARRAADPFRDVLSSVRASGDRLQDTLHDLARLNRPRGSVEADVITRVRDYAGELAREAAKQRVQDSERLRLTSETTARSAEMLGELVKAASLFMARMDQRDVATDEQVRRQLRVAVASVVVSAILTAATLVVSLLGYWQDRAKNAADNAASEKALAREQVRDVAIDQQLQVLRSIQAQNARMQAMGTAPAIRASSGAARTEGRRPANAHQRPVSAGH